MTVAAARERDVPVASRRRRPFRWSRLLLHGTILVLIVIWLLPTIGLFINSIRTPVDVARTGWWNAFLPPWNPRLPASV